MPHLPDVMLPWPDRSRTLSEKVSKKMPGIGILLDTRQKTIETSSNGFNYQAALSKREAYPFPDTPYRPGSMGIRR